MKRKEPFFVYTHFGREQGEQDSFHIWFGPLGIHIMWPDLWRSRFGWASKWRKSALPTDWYGDW